MYVWLDILALDQHPGLHAHADVQMVREVLKVCSDGEWWAWEGQVYCMGWLDRGPLLMCQAIALLVGTTSQQIGPKRQDLVVQQAIATYWCGGWQVLRLLDDLGRRACFLPQVSRPC